MQVEYKRDVSHNYLILKEEKQINTSSYQVRMLEENVIPSVLRCTIQRLNGDVLFYYDITSRQSIASCYEEKKIKGADLRMIFGGLVTVLEEMGEFLMDPGQLVLAPEYIYLDPGKKEVRFCCLPGYDHSVQEQFRELAEYFLPRLDHEDPDAVKLGYGVYRKTLDPGFQLETVKETIYRREDSSPDMPVQEEAEKIYPEENAEENFSAENWMPEETSRSPKAADKKLPWWILWCGTGALAVIVTALLCFMGYLPAIQAEIVLAAAILILAVTAISRWAKEQKKKKTRQSEQWRQKVREELQKEEKSEVLYHPSDSTDQEIKEKTMEESTDQPVKEVDKQVNFTGELWKKEEEQEQFTEETVLLSKGNTKGPASLVSTEPGALATIYLDQELTVIGKMEQAADAVIPVETVSRVHARIRHREDGYYLADLNSRNGTSVNGRMLKPEEEYLLQNEDHVDFAKARYIFLK